MHILPPVTDNCPTWISGRERMSVVIISWAISAKNVDGLGFKLVTPGLKYKSEQKPTALSGLANMSLPSMSCWQNIGTLCLPNGHRKSKIPVNCYTISWSPCYYQSTIIIYRYLREVNMQGCQLLANLKGWWVRCEKWISTVYIMSFQLGLIFLNITSCHEM